MGATDGVSDAESVPNSLNAFLEFRFMIRLTRGANPFRWIPLASTFLLLVFPVGIAQPMTVSAVLGEDERGGIEDPPVDGYGLGTVQACSGKVLLNCAAVSLKIDFACHMVIFLDKPAQSYEDCTPALLGEVTVDRWLVPGSFEAQLSGVCSDSRSDDWLPLLAQTFPFSCSGATVRIPWGKCATFGGTASATFTWALGSRSLATSRSVKECLGSASTHLVVVGLF